MPSMIAVVFSLKISNNFVVTYKECVVIAAWAISFCDLLDGVGVCTCTTAFTPEAELFFQRNHEKKQQQWWCLSGKTLV